MMTVFSSRKRSHMGKAGIVLIVVALIMGAMGCDRIIPKSDIRTWTDLYNIRYDLSKDYRLMNDLDSTTDNYAELAGPSANGGKGWEPIERFRRYFSGTFDGRGFEIRDLCINRPSASRVGLFGRVAAIAVIKDIGLMDVNVIGQDYAGSLSAINGGTVSNSYATGSTAGTSYVGGLVGTNEGAVTDSYATCDVAGSGQYVGGLAGHNSGTVSNSYSTGNVIGAGSYVGGLAGHNSGTVSGSNSTGNVTGGNQYAGGLAGWNSGTVISSNSTGSVTGVGWYVGGLAGCNSGTVSASHSDGNVVGQQERAGGLVGWNDRGTVQSSYSTGNVAGSSRVGGLVGYNDKGTVKINSYATGSVTGTEDRVGGLVGYNLGGDVNKCHYAGNVAGKKEVGGLVGYNEGGTVRNNSYSSGDVTGTEDRIGGLVGYNDGEVSNSYSSSNVIGNSRVGGLVGWNKDSVEKSYSSCNVTGNSYVGGLVGENLRLTGDTYGGTIGNSYSSGNVIRISGEGIIFGGSVGSNSRGAIICCYSTGSVSYPPGPNPVDKGFAGSVTIGTGYLMTGNFWDVDTSSQTSTAGEATGNSTAEMQLFATFDSDGWDICTVSHGVTNSTCIWNIVDGETYPFLSWQQV
ncbi:MAG: hypothetical protein A2Z77_07800 [Chloroflexi bacterium RBG_13_51_36]|nr:MAG: hypothetical protein A2Z77_07800 [Chloroflexi bacterium RBG_13_51_36]